MNHDLTPSTFMALSYAERSKLANWRRLSEADQKVVQFTRWRPDVTTGSAATVEMTTEPSEPMKKPTAAEQIARIQENVKASTAGNVETRAKVEGILANWSAAGGLHSPAASKDVGPQPRSATEARVLFNTGKLKAPFTDKTKQLLAEAGCDFEKSAELKRILANANPSALTEQERAEAFPQSPELTRILANAGLSGRRKDR